MQQPRAAFIGIVQAFCIQGIPVRTIESFLLIVLVAKLHGQIASQAGKNRILGGKGICLVIGGFAIAGPGVDKDQPRSGIMELRRTGAGSCMTTCEIPLGRLIGAIVELKPPQIDEQPGMIKGRRVNIEKVFDFLQGAHAIIFDGGKRPSHQKVLTHLVKFSIPARLERLARLQNIGQWTTFFLCQLVEIREPL